MRIVVHGQQAFGHKLLEELISQNEDVVAVCVAPEKPGKPEDPLKTLALEKGIPVHQPSSWKTPESLALMQSFNADVCMMAYVLLFVPESVLYTPRLGSIQYHPSLLPMHRGPSSINWPIAQGAKETGLTIFWPDKGLDEGPILLQKHCTIEPDETLGSVYFNKLFPMGIAAMLESLELLKNGSAPKIEQQLELGSYESWFGKAEAKINWSQTAKETFNLIRATDPQPGAWTLHKGQEIKLYSAELKQGSGTPGEVIAVDENGVEVACQSGSLLIGKIRSGTKKLTAAEYASGSDLKVGDTLTID